MIIMICVKQLNAVGGTESDLTIGKRYSVSPIPVALPEDDEMKQPEDPNVHVWFNDTNKDKKRIYPMNAFVTLDQWRELQLNKLI